MMQRESLIPDSEEPAEDVELAAVVDRYVDALQRGDDQTCRTLAAQYPRLQALAGCLDDLEGLGPLVSSGFEPRPHDQDGDIPLGETVIVSGVESDTGDDTGHAPGDTAAAQTFGKYELLEEIGRGGMGVVYKARQTDLNRTVAVKMILSSQFASQEEIRRFYAEARAAGGLRHPNVVGIHEVGLLYGQHFFAMDFIEGQSLADVLKEGPLDAYSATRKLSTIARAVDYLHKHHIVHRDLKPSNILLDAADAPFVTDFGLAKVFQEDGQATRTGTIVGTPSYMAPEQAAGRTSEVSLLSDVYSLGAILYEMLTGRPPFREASPLDTLVQVLEGEPSLPSRLNRRIPRELELICLRCLEKEPAQRYASAAALADDLDRFARNEAVQARPSGLPARLRRWMRREPALVSRWVALLLAAGAIQGHYLLAGKEFQAAHYDYHFNIMATLAVWAAVCFAFQKLLNLEAMVDVARFGWAAADAILLTTVLYMSNGPPGTLLIGYPLLVASSGLFFRVRLVWFTTLMCLISYATLILYKRDIDEPAHYPVIFALVLAVLGFMVAYQVFRVRVLSRFYESRR